MAKLVSGKVKKTSPTQVSADRYNFISLDQVEPDLGVPDASGKVLSSTTAGVRSWINPTSLSVSSPITNSGNASIGQYIIGFDFSTNNTWTGTQAFNGNVTLGSSANLTVGGNLIVNGTQTIVNTTNLAVTDSIIYLAQNQYASDTLDIGFYGAYGTTGGSVSNHVHAGLVRSNIDKAWYLFSNGVEPTDQTVDLSSVSYDTLKLGAVVVTGGTSSFTPANAFSSAVNLTGKVKSVVPTGIASNTTTTVTYTASNHGFVVGQDVNIVHANGQYPWNNAFMPIISVTTDTFTIAVNASYVPPFGTGPYAQAITYQTSKILDSKDSTGTSTFSVTPHGQVSIVGKSVLGNTFSIVDTAGNTPALAVTNIVVTNNYGNGMWTLTIPGNKLQAGQWLYLVGPDSFGGDWLISYVAPDGTVQITGVDGTLAYPSGTTTTAYPLGLTFYAYSNVGSGFGLIRNRGSLTPFTVSSPDNGSTTVSVKEVKNATAKGASAQIWTDYSSNVIAGVSSSNGIYVGSRSVNYWRASDGLTINGSNVINNFGVVTGVSAPSNAVTTVRVASTANISEFGYTYGGGTSSAVSGTIYGNTLTVTGPTFVVAVGQIVTGIGISGTVTVTAVSGADPYTVTLSSSLSATASGSYSFLGADGGTGVGNYFRSISTTIDGVSVAVNDRILLKNQTSGIVNGIYYVSQISGGTTVYLTRATDSDNSVLGELAPGKRVFVTEGTVNGGTSWVLSSRGTATNSTVKINTDVVTFTPVTSPATATPLINGTAAVGTSVLYARQDHVHPTDTTRAPLASPSFTTPSLGVATATSINGTTIPSSATLVTSTTASLPSVTSVNSTSIPFNSTLYSANTLIVTAATTGNAATGVGYMGLPQNSATTGSYTVVAADAGTHIYASATRTVTIDSNANLALPIGTTLTFIAGTGATMTIAITTDTMYLAGAGTTGSRTLAAFGMATAVKITATSWMISGNGLT